MLMGRWNFRREARRGPRLTQRFEPGRSLPTLEPRRLLAVEVATVGPSDSEQYMLELINRARSDPPAEARRLLAEAASDSTLRAAVGDWDLEASARVIASYPPTAPLAFDARLIAAARAWNSAVLATNSQAHSPSHYLIDPSVAAAPDGLPYFDKGAGAWAAGENVFAYSGNVRSDDIRAYVDYLHDGLAIDWGNPDHGHLRNLLNPGPSQAESVGRQPYSRVGIGLLTGVRPSTPPPADPELAANRGLDVGPVLVTQEFAWREGDPALTGTFYRDRDGDHFYSPGEGLGGVTVVATGLDGQGVRSVVSWASGGYTLDLPPGRYLVAASGSDVPRVSTTIVVNDDNVGWSVDTSTQSPTTSLPLTRADASTSAFATSLPRARPTAGLRFRDIREAARASRLESIRVRAATSDPRPRPTSILERLRNRA